MKKRCTDQGSCSDQSVLAFPVGSLHLLCEVRPSASDEVAQAYSVYRCGQGVAAQCQISHPNVNMLLQTLSLPPDIFQAVLANAVQQHGTASSLRLTSRSLAHKCGAALVTGETARQAQILPPSRDEHIGCSAYSQAPAAPTNCRHPLPHSTESAWPARGITVLATASGHPPARLPQQHPETGQCDLRNR